MIQASIRDLLRDAEGLVSGPGDLMYRRSVAKGVAWRCAHDRALRRSGAAAAQVCRVLCPYLAEEEAGKPLDHVCPLPCSPLHESF